MTKPVKCGEGGASLAEWDFDAWVKLASDDPSAFEAMRQSMVNELIAEAPQVHQRRLNGLQWRIDQERNLARSPLGACIRISRMMWESVTDEGGLVDRCQRLSELVDKPVKS